MLAIELQRSCGFMGTVNVVFARPISTRVVAGKLMMKIKATLKKLKRGDVVSIDWIDAGDLGGISREGCPTLSHTQHRFKSYSVAQSLVCADMPEQLDFGYQGMPKWHDSPRC